MEKNTITIYELLGLIKDGKQPSKIKFCGNIYEWEDDWYLTKEKNYKVCLGGKKEDINILINAFNENVEIIEEDKEDIEYLGKLDLYVKGKDGYEINIEKIGDKINKLIRQVNKLKNKE